MLRLPEREHWFYKTTYDTHEREMSPVTQLPDFEVMNGVDLVRRER
jgi:hypothetical protein